MWDLWCTKWQWNRFFSQYFSLPCQYHLTNAAHSSSSTCCSYQKDKQTKPGNLPESNGLADNRRVVSASIFTSVFQNALSSGGYATALNKRAAVCWQQPCNSSALVLHHEQSSTLRYKPVHSADTVHRQAWSTCYVVPATLAIFGLHAGIMKFNTQNEGWIHTYIHTHVRVLMCIILPEYLSMHHM